MAVGRFSVELTRERLDSSLRPNMQNRVPRVVLVLYICIGIYKEGKHPHTHTHGVSDVVLRIGTKNKIKKKGGRLADRTKSKGTKEKEKNNNTRRDTVIH